VSPLEQKFTEADSEQIACEIQYGMAQWEPVATSRAKLSSKSQNLKAQKTAYKPCASQHLIAITDALFHVIGTEVAFPLAKLVPRSVLRFAFRSRLLDDLRSLGLKYTVCSKCLALDAA